MSFQSSPLVQAVQRMISPEVCLAGAWVPFAIGGSAEHAGGSLLSGFCHGSARNSGFSHGCPHVVLCYPVPRSGCKRMMLLASCGLPYHYVSSDGTSKNPHKPRVTRSIRSPRPSRNRSIFKRDRRQWQRGKRVRLVPKQMGRILADHAGGSDESDNPFRPLGRQRASMQ